MSDLMPVSQAIADLPVRVSERRFRTVARRIGRHRGDGANMRVTASDVNAILDEMTREGRQNAHDKTLKIDEIAAGYVYFIDCNEYTKIGFSKWHPRNGGRQQTLGTISPYQLRLWGFARGPKELEWHLHQWFASRRVKGEWFLLTPFDRRELARLARRTHGYVNNSTFSKRRMKRGLS